TVTEHDPPRHLALETDLAFGHLRISYLLEVTAGGGTRFQRDLDFPELGAGIAAAMDAQSAQGVADLARLVEREIPAPEAGAAGQPLVRVGVDLAKRDVGVLGARRLVNRPERPARPAPRSPPVDQGNALLGDDLLEGVLSQGDGAHGCSSVRRFDLLSPLGL